MASTDNTTPIYCDGDTYPAQFRVAVRVPGAGTGLDLRGKRIDGGVTVVNCKDVRTMKMKPTEEEAK